MLNAQAYLSSHLQLVLKQISLLLETLPELLQLRTELLIPDACHFIIHLSVHFQRNLQYTQDSFSLI
ncbi:hypothetical protein [Acinetobacter sp.]|uniref:hypothetical protein n=1 Tax=Acinetobacter sp. TaxID=472 RepID=UPI0035B458BA